MASPRPAPAAAPYLLHFPLRFFLLAESCPQSVGPWRAHGSALNRVCSMCLKYLRKRKRARARNFPRTPMAAEVASPIAPSKFWRIQSQTIWLLSAGEHLAPSRGGVSNLKKQVTELTDCPNNPQVSCVFGLSLNEPHLSGGCHPIENNQNTYQLPIKQGQFWF